MQIQSCLLPRREGLAPVIRVLPVQVAYARHLCQHSSALSSCKWLARHQRWWESMTAAGSTSDPTCFELRAEPALEPTPQHRNFQNQGTRDEESGRRRESGHGKRKRAETHGDDDNDAHNPSQEAAASPPSSRCRHLSGRADTGDDENGRPEEKEISDRDRRRRATVRRKRRARSEGRTSRTDGGSGSGRRPTATTTPNHDSTDDDHAPTTRAKKPLRLHLHLDVGT